MARALIAWGGHEGKKQRASSCDEIIEIRCAIRRRVCRVAVPLVSILDKFEF
jgi:hypothetical protein